ncbi:hypothetical protein GX586_10685 [bacterium]|nr:hypothetical protein [bacterium]
MYWWKWDEQNVRAQFTNGSRGDKGFAIDRTPAADVMKRWHGRTDRPDTQHSSSAIHSHASAPDQLTRRWISTTLLPEGRGAGCDTPGKCRAAQTT